MKLGPRTYTPADWLRTRPYKQLGQYDQFFVQRCRDIYEVLNEYSWWFEESDIDRDEVVELTSMLGGYFEDFISEIGIWSAFVRRNQTLYGYPLPFYDLTDYDTDYINEADIAFLIWKYVSERLNQIYSPDHPLILEISEQIFELLEDEIDDAPASSFFETYLTFDAKTDFSTLKDKLFWLANVSYLLGTEFRHKAQEAIEEEITEDDIRQGFAHQITYTIIEPYQFNQRSSFSALSAAEWMAEIARATPAEKEAIRQTQLASPGLFRFIDHAANNTYLFQHRKTERFYRVRRDSIREGKGLANPIPGQTVVTMSVREYHGEWHLSGPFGDLTKLDYQQVEQLQPHFWQYTDEQQARLLAMEKANERAFLDFFGGRLALFETETELLAAEQELLVYSNQLNVDPNLPPRTPEQEAAFQERLAAAKKRSPATDTGQTDVALFYEHGAGWAMHEEVRQNGIDLLTADSLTKEQTLTLFRFLITQSFPAFATYLTETYGTKNVRYPIAVSNVDAVRDMAFLQRFWQPEEFGPTYPMMSLI